MSIFGFVIVGVFEFLFLIGFCSFFGFTWPSFVAIGLYVLYVIYAIVAIFDYQEHVAKHGVIKPPESDIDLQKVINRQAEIERISRDYGISVVDAATKYNDDRSSY